MRLVEVEPLVSESAIRVYVGEGSIIQSDETPTPRSRVTKPRVAR